MSNFYFTKEGLEKLKEELKVLKEVKRREILERIKETRTYGDVTENSEYEDAKNEQAFIEGRILELENIFKKAQVIPKPKGDKVSLGSKVKVKIDNQEENFTIVGPREADPERGLISFESPLGRALMDRGAGEEVEVETPSGKVKYKIKSLE